MRSPQQRRARFCGSHSWPACARRPLAVYKIVRSELATTDVVDLRAGNDLLLEEYLDGVEFDVDPVLHDGESARLERFPELADRGALVSGDGPSLPAGSRREAGPPTRSAVRGDRPGVRFRCGVLHVEGKCTSRGPRIVKVNARMGGGRIHQIVEAVWGVDLIEAHVRGALGLPQQLAPSRKPRCAIVNALLYAPRRAGWPPCISPRAPVPTWDRCSTWRLMWDKRSTDRTGSPRRRSPR